MTKNTAVLSAWVALLAVGSSPYKKRQRVHALQYLARTNGTSRS